MPPKTLEDALVRLEEVKAKRNYWRKQSERCAEETALLLEENSVLRASLSAAEQKLVTCQETIASCHALLDEAGREDGLLKDRISALLDELNPPPPPPPPPLRLVPPCQPEC